MLTEPRQMAGFARDENGAIAVVVSLLLTVLLGFVALGVDVASLYRERASLQLDSDMTAMSAVVNPNAATARAQLALGRNSRGAQTLTNLTTGRFLRNPALPPDARFTALQAGSPGINAIKVTLQDDAPLHFAKIFTEASNVTLTRTATAIRTGAASFSLDSNIARLDVTDLNAALSDSFDAEISLSAGEREILSQTSINAGDLLTELIALTGATARNPAAILDQNVAASTLVAALRTLSPGTVSGGLAQVENAAGATAIPVETVVGGIDSALGLTATEFASNIELSALDVLSALTISNERVHQLDLSANASAPGVLSVAARIAAGEPPARSGWIALGEKGVQLFRAAARLETKVDFNPSTLGNIGTGITITRAQLPVYVELAGAAATLQEISCASSGPAAIAARFATANTPLHPNNGTSVAALYLGMLDEASFLNGPISPSDLDFADVLDLTIEVSLPLLPNLVVEGVTVQARSYATVGASQQDTITFTNADVQANRMTRSFGAGGLLGSGLQILMSPENTEIRLKPGQEGLIAGAASPLLETALAAIPNQLFAALSAPLDTVLDGALGTAGLNVGEGQLTLTGHHCELVRLIQ